jgi:hypothetical protein
VEVLQQSTSRLEPWCEFTTVMGERKRFDKVGVQTSAIRTERKGPTAINNVDDSSRWAYHSNYVIANTLDRQDGQNLAPLALPTSKYISGAVKRYHRDVDDVACATALGAVITGENGTTSTAFTAGQQIAAGGTGLTIPKLIQIQEIFNTADVDPDDARVIVVHSKQITNMLNTLEVRSADYAEVKALVSGKVNTFMGFTFKINNRLTKVSTTRTCVAWVKGAIQIIKGNIQTRVDQLPGQNYATQIYSDYDLGGVRIHDEAVVQVDCTEA